MRAARHRDGRRALIVLSSMLVVGACSDVRNPPPVDPARAGRAADQLLVASCYPCHSTAASRPLLGRLAPSSWPGSARRVLDFSEWGRYDEQRRASALRAIAAAVAGGRMPPSDYTFFDHAAALTADERARLLGWASSQLPAAPPP